MNRKVLALLFSLILLICIAVPGTLASAPDEGETTEVHGETAAVQPGPGENEATPPVENTPQENDAQPEEPLVGGGETPAAQEPPAEPADGENPIEEDTAEGESPAEGEKPADPEGTDGESAGQQESEEPEEEKSLFEKLMACTTLEQVEEILELATEEQFAQLTEEELQKLDEHIRSLEPEALPPISLTSDPPVASELAYELHAYTWVAPFLGPVVGDAH